MKYIYIYTLIISSLLFSCNRGTQILHQKNSNLVDQIIDASMLELINYMDNCTDVSTSVFNQIIHNDEFEGYHTDLDSVFIGTYNFKRMNMQDGTINENLPKSYDYYGMPFYFTYDYTKVIKSDKNSIDFDKYLKNRDLTVKDEIRFSYSNIFKQEMGYLIVIENDDIDNYINNIAFISLDESIKVTDITFSIEWCGPYKQ